MSYPMVLTTRAVSQMAMDYYAIGGLKKTLESFKKVHKSW